MCKYGAHPTHSASCACTPHTYIHTRLPTYTYTHILPSCFTTRTRRCLRQARCSAPRARGCSSRPMGRARCRPSTPASCTGVCHWGCVCVPCVCVEGQRDYTERGYGKGMLPAVCADRWVSCQGTGCWPRQSTPGCVVLCCADGRMLAVAPNMPCTLAAAIHSHPMSCDHHHSHPAATTAIHALARPRHYP